MINFKDEIWFHLKNQSKIKDDELSEEVIGEFSGTYDSINDLKVELEERVLALHDKISIAETTNYTAYNIGHNKNFVSFIPRRNKMWCTLNMTSKDLSKAGSSIIATDIPLTGDKKTINCKFLITLESDIDEMMKAINISLKHRLKY